MRNYDPRTDLFLEKYYAVNVCDLIAFTGQPLHPVNMLLVPLLTKQTAECELKRIDGGAALVKADIKQERWAAVVQIIREGAGRLDPIPKHKLRIYESKTGRGSWRRI